MVFTTYQSGEAIADASKKAKYSFDLGICDEAHKTVGAKGKAFSHLLYEKNIKVKRRLFMTATERRYGGSADKVISMDDHDLYGETFELLSFKEALECKPAILSDYKIITIGVTQQEIRENIRKNILVRPSKGSWNEETEIQMLTAALALRKAIKLKGIKHAVSFHSSIARAEAFRETQDNLTKHIKWLSASWIPSMCQAKLPTADREKRLWMSLPSRKRSLITNARCLTEGVDVKQIDCVVFADPKKSAVDIVQAVGRALRPFDGKKFGYVIVPQLIDAKSVKGRIEQNESFKDILMTLRALAANDERIVEYFRSVSEGKRISKRKAPVEFVTPVGTKIDYKQFEDDLKLKVWGRLAKLSWRPFEEARKFSRNLNLPNTKSWFEYNRGTLRDKSSKPFDIPSNPNNVYKYKGWINYGDWLGTENVANHDKKFLPFNEARDFAISLGLNNYGQWKEFTKSKAMPKNIPVSPANTYKDEGWVGYGDWLGTGKIAPHKIKYLPFEEAREYARSLDLKSKADWIRYRRSGNLPDNISGSPSRTYKDLGWKGFGDWLDTGNKASHLIQYRDFNSARKYVRKLSLSSQIEWIKYTKSGSLPNNIPATPQNTYKNKGWKGLGDWLGTNRIATQKRIYKPFNEARAFVRNLGLKSQKEWENYKSSGSRPIDIPAHPRTTYKDEGWTGIGDWLGTGTIASFNKKYLPFDAARRFVHKLNLKNEYEWRAYSKSSKKPANIPATPQNTYKNKGWKGLGDWLGTGTLANKDKTYQSFKIARSFVRRLKLKNQKEWQKYAKSHKRPKDIPSSPAKTYKK